MHCPSCRSKDVGEIRFGAISSGVEFRYCRTCERRWWTSPAGPVQLDSVLDQAAALPRA